MQWYGQVQVLSWNRQGLALVVGIIYHNVNKTKEGGLPIGNPPSSLSLNSKNYFLFKARSIATAIATVAPTIGLLPMPRKPIIST